MEIDDTFINIVASENYKTYADTVIYIDGKNYRVRIPTENVGLYLTAQNRIRYRVEKPKKQTSPPRKRGRKKIYDSDEERRNAYIERRRNGMLNHNFGKSIKVVG